MGNRFREKKVEEGLEAPEVAAAEMESGGVMKPQAATENAAAGPRKRQGGGLLARVIGGDLLSDKFVLRQIPLLLLCIGYLLLVVGNRYRIESLSREKQAIEERINFLREERIQMQKQYQQSVKISQIAEDLSGTGVGITAGPPYAIEK